MGYYDYDYLTTTAQTSNVNVWFIISVVVAIVGGIAIYYTFLNKANDGKFKGFLGHLYNFLNFKFFIIEDMIRILYLIFAIGLTLISFSFITINFLAFLGVLILGNLAIRISYEMIMFLLDLFRNVREINSKIKKEKKS